MVRTIIVLAFFGFRTENVVLCVPAAGNLGPACWCEERGGGSYCLTTGLLLRLLVRWRSLDAASSIENSALVGVLRTFVPSHPSSLQTLPLVLSSKPG